MKTLVHWVVSALLLVAIVGSAWAQRTVQVETLEPLRCTEGTTMPVNMVEAGFATPGVFGGDVVVHWFGMENAGAVLGFRIPVAAPGRQRVVVGLARSWDYGLYQFSINGEDAGGTQDLATGGEPEVVVPAKVDLGIHDLPGGGFVLGVRFVGASPKAKDGPNPGSMALDYVQLLPASTGGGTSGGSPAGPRFEVEKLQVIEASEGSTSSVDLLEAGLASAGVFGANTVVHWFGMENPGAVLRVRVPVAIAGRYRVTIGVAKSWDYGLYQCLVNGDEAGPRLDLASTKEPEHVYPLVVDLGTHDLKRPTFELGFRFEGPSPNAQDGPNPMSGGFDWVRVTPVVARAGKQAR
jgi:hypothetical protein